MRLLLVEDDDALADMLRRGLREEGFAVTREADGDRGLAAAFRGGWDLILLDGMLPGMDGVELCRRLREARDEVPVIMLTVRGEVEDRVAGLGAGADDYVTKPFSFEELVARIHARLRPRAAPEEIRRGDGVRLDPTGLRVRGGPREVQLTPREYQLLDYLVRRQGRVIPESELLREVWDLDFSPRTNVVNVHLHRLRTKLEPLAAVGRIETLRGQGYRWTEGQE